MMSGSADTPARDCSSAPEVVAGAAWYTLYTEGDDLFDAMLAAIRKARRRVWLATYIFAADDVGRRFVEALGERARAGVDVRLTVDALGSFLLFPRRLENALCGQGVKVRRYHRWHWREPMRYNRRDHRKLLVVDEEEAFLGGFNIHRQESRRASGAQRWRDTHIRLTGELALQASELFNAFWNGRPDWTPAPAAAGWGELLPNYSRRCRRRLRGIYRDMFDRARRYLYVTTPYFVPDRPMQKGLIAAARRGVDVRVLVPRKSDVRLVQWASRAAYAGLLANGVRIFEYLPRMLHAKTIVSDDDFASVGTANMDYRSFFLNYELNLFSGNRDLCLKLYDQFCSDLRESEEIRTRSWKRRRWNARFLEWIGWMARRWL